MVEDENSMDDNDPIDVNKFLASDGIRIKEERTFEESFAEYEQVNTRAGINYVALTKGMLYLGSDHNILGLLLKS
jgi:hypothetical protein